jgi:hypothetical protein
VPEGVLERLSELGAFDFEAVTGAGSNTHGEAQRCGSEEMHVSFAWPTEYCVLEVVVLEPRDVVRHVRFATPKRALPQHLAVPHDPRFTAQALRQLPKQ